MSSRSPHARNATAWFRLGNIDVTTTVLVVGLGILSVLAAVIAPTLPGWLAFHISPVLQGQVWRVVTWPFANFISFGTLISLLMLWYFGRDLEETLGRRGMMWLLVGIWASFTLVSAGVGAVLPGGALAGMGLVQLAVLLLWSAEYPSRRFLFNIPAWVFGAFIVALQVLSYLAYRDWSSLVTLVLGMALVALVARRLGMLGEYRWLPGRPAQPRSARPAKPSRKERRASERRASDDARMDALLAKISEQGLHSLSDRERKELKDLSTRRRR